MKKKCSKCLCEKEITDFHKSKSGKNSTVSQCKECRKNKRQK